MHEDKFTTGIFVFVVLAPSFLFNLCVFVLQAYV